MILDWLGLKYGTDKSSGYHDYLGWYEQFLAFRRDDELYLLEIGVGDGCSLRMWRDYFSRAPLIIGMDIEPSRVQFEDLQRGVKIFIGDQSSEVDLCTVIHDYGPFDIVVDDAGHQPDHQISCYDLFLPLMKPAGIYILEDICGQPVIDYLMEYASGCVQGSDRVKSMSFYKDTSITVVHS